MTILPTQGSHKGLPLRGREDVPLLRITLTLTLSTQGRGDRTPREASELQE